MVATLAAVVVAGLALLAGASPPGAHAARPAPRLRGAEVQDLGAEVTASDLDLVKKLDDQFAQAYNGGACCLGALRCGETPLHPQREPAFPPSAPLSCPVPWSFLLLQATSAAVLPCCRSSDAGAAPPSLAMLHSAAVTTLLSGRPRQQQQFSFSLLEAAAADTGC